MENLKKFEQYLEREIEETKAVRDSADLDMDNSATLQSLMYKKSRKAALDTKIEVLQNVLREYQSLQGE